MCYTCYTDGKKDGNMKHQFLECGKIINTHGFRGAVKLESWCDTPGVLAGLPRYYLQTAGGMQPLTVAHASVFREFVIAELEGVADEDAANRLRGKTVYAARDDLPLPSGGYFLVDVVGLPVRHADTGESLGTVVRVDTRGKNNLFVLETPNGEALLPDVPQFVIRVDVEGAVWVRPIPGLLDGGAENV